MNQAWGAYSTSHAQPTYSNAPQAYAQHPSYYPPQPQVQPFGGYPQQQQPYPHPQPNGYMQAGSSFGSGLQKLRLIFGAIIVVCALPVIAWGLYSANRESKPFVVFVNDADKPVTVTLDGKEIGTLAPKKSVIAQVAVGSHDVAISGGVTAKSSITVSNKSMFRGAYIVGNKGHVAVVTKYYANGKPPFDDKIDVVAKGASFREIDGVSTNALDVDQAFPSSISVPKGATYGSVTHLCHVDPKTLKSDDPTVGCSGF
jgi:hypothetical protein